MLAGNTIITTDTGLKEIKRREKIKAIDEFVDRLDKHMQENWVSNLEYGITWDDIELIAEQIKQDFYMVR